MGTLSLAVPAIGLFIRAAEQFYKDHPKSGEMKFGAATAATLSFFDQLVSRGHIEKAPPIEAIEGAVQAIFSSTPHAELAADAGSLYLVRGPITALKTV